MRLPAAILRDIRCTLQPLIDEAGGVLDVASDLGHAMEILATSPSKFRVVLMWDGYGAHEHSREGMAVVRLSTFLHVNLGMTKEPGEKLYKESMNGDMPFLDRLEQLSKWMRALRWPHGADVDPAGLSLQDSEWVLDTPGNSKAHMLGWALDQALAPFDKTLVIDISDGAGAQNNYEQEIK